MISRPLYVHNVTVLGAEGALGTALRIAGQRISAIDPLPDRNDCMIDGRGGLLIPGLINAHDHLELNSFKRLKYRDRYTHSVQWFEDIEARFDTDPDLTGPRRQPIGDRLWIGLLKNLLSGVTTVCHHNPFYTELQNDVPIQVVKEYGFGHSLFRGDNLVASYKNTSIHEPWIIHLGEGIDQTAWEEFEQLEHLGALGQNTVLVHGVGLTEGQRQALIERGGGLIWCPGSNTFLFGQTVEVQELAHARKLALGSDSRLTGELDLLRELSIAAACKQLTGQELFRAVTTDAAHLLRLKKGGMGQIRTGGIADLVMLPAPHNSDLFSILTNLQRSRLELVMRAGRPLVGSLATEKVFSATNTQFNSIKVDGIEKIMASDLSNRMINSQVKEPGITLL